ncbi:hypothetical protein [Pseudokineococcus sp. 1T1Z-3]|uniref:hypothetical protein n=1 Tax=Pseudokineococcus sp. 1T1Z-3 TaxID=3132745 RepID=UPI0030B43A69
MPSPRRPRRHLAAAVLTSALLVTGAGASAGASAGTSGASSGPDAAAASSSTTSSLPRTTAWTADVRSAPLAPGSRAMVANLHEQVTSRYGGVAAFNVWQYNAAVYRVGASQRRVDVRFDDCQGKGYTPKQLYGPGGHFTRVPIPSGAVPAVGRDGQLTIYSPSSDQLWEFWRAKKTASGWSACWGGRIDQVSRSAGFFGSGMGASASGLATSLGAVGIAEAKAGRIDHAIALAIPHVGHRSTISYPAQRSDGSDTRSAAIPMGTRLRLDPSVDVDALRLHPVAAAVAKASQRYGFVVVDRSGAVAVTTESGAPTKARTGSDPWYGILAGRPGYAVMKGFPWDRLQVVEKDWGKP